MKKLWYLIPSLIAGGILALVYINYTNKPLEYLQAEQFIEDELLVVVKIESMEFVRTFTGRDSALIILDKMDRLPNELKLVDLLKDEWDLVHYYDQRKTMQIGEIWKAKLENRNIVYLLKTNGEFSGFVNNLY